MDKIKYLTLQIVIFPIILIILTSAFITLYNISSMKETIENYKSSKLENFIAQNKQKIHDKVKYINNSVLLENETIEDILKQKLQQRVSEALILANNIYDNYKDTLSKEQIRQKIIEQLSFIRFNKNRGYYFAYDYDTNLIISHPLKSFLYKDMSSYKDSNGKIIFDDFKKQVNKYKFGFSEYNFYKPTSMEKNYLKISCVSKFEPLGIVLGTGEYVHVLKNEIQELFLKRFSKFQEQDNTYIFIYKIHNIKGGKNFATMILNPNRPELIGQKISDDYKDEKGFQFRKDFIKKINENGEAYTSYWYKKLNSNEIKQKMSYFYHQKDWNWIIASGFYFEDFEEELETLKKDFAKYQKKQLENSITWTLLLSLFTAIISFIISSRIKKLIQNNTNKILERTSQLNEAQQLANICSFKCDLVLEKSELSEMAYEIFEIEKKKKLFVFDDFLNLIHPQDKKIFEKEYEKALENKSKIMITHRLYFENEKVKWVNTYISFIFEHDYVTQVVGVIQDITKEYELQKNIKEKEQLFIQQSKMASMGEMIGNIAHQWRQPLNLISTVSTALKFNIEFNTFNKDEAIKDLEGLNKSAQYLSSTIDDFRNFFNSNKGKSIFSIVQAYKRALNLLTAKFKNSEIKVIEHIDDIKLMGIENEMIQVFINILNNAKDALESIDEEKLIFVDIFEEDEELIIKIKDNANGIKKSIINKIFEPYFTTKHQSKGTGIGMYMSFQIIHNSFNGTIEVQNSEYKYNDKDCIGAEFIIKIPKEDK